MSAIKSFDKLLISIENAHSVRKLFTGFILAALTARALTVINVMRTAASAEPTGIHHEIVVRYSNLTSHSDKT